MAQKRRDFLKTIGLTGAASLLPAADLLALNGQSSPEGFVTTEAEQETYLIGPRRSPLTLMVDRRSKGVTAISFCREEIAAGGAIPVHKHLKEDEVIYVQYGSGIFTLGEKEHEVKTGSVAYVPKGTWHGMRNTGTAALRMLFSYTPSGFENYFREIGVPPGAPSKKLGDEEWKAIDKKYGIVYKPR
jgi:quercetin dioxygenase-like cupin family protein